MKEIGSRHAREDNVHNLETLRLRKTLVFNTYINYAV